MWQQNHLQWEHDKLWCQGKAILCLIWDLNRTSSTFYVKLVTLQCESLWLKASLRSEDPSGNDLVQTPTQIKVYYSKFLRAVSIWVLNIFKDEDFTTSLGFLPPLLHFLLIGMNHSWSGRRWPLNQQSWTPLLTRVVSHEILPDQRLFYWSLGLQSLSLLFFLPLRILNSTIIAKAVPAHPWPVPPCLEVSGPAQLSTVRQGLALLKLPFRSKIFLCSFWLVKVFGIFYFKCMKTCSSARVDRQLKTLSFTQLNPL